MSLPANISLALVNRNHVCVKHSISNGVTREYLLPFDHQLGNTEGCFDIGGRNFSFSARDISLVGNVLHAKLSTSGGVWWDDQIAIDVDFPLPTISGATATPSIKFRRCDFMRLKPCRNPRLIGGFLLGAECLQADRTYQETYLDLNQFLGKRNGAFDKHGENFSKGAANIQLVGATLFANLKCDDGTVQRASIALTSILQFTNGSAIPLRHVETEALDLEVLRDEPSWLMNVRDIRLLNYKRKRRWYLLAECLTPHGGVRELMVSLHDILGPHVDEMFCHSSFSSPQIPEIARETRLKNGLLTTSFKKKDDGNNEWMQKSIDLREILVNDGADLILRRSGSECLGCGGFFHAGTLYTPASGCFIPVNLPAVESVRANCAFCRLIHDTIAAYTPSARSHEAWIRPTAASIAGFYRFMQRPTELVVRAHGIKHKRSLQNILKFNKRVPSTEICCTLLLEPGGSDTASGHVDGRTDSPRKFRTLARNTNGKCWLEPDRRWPLIQEWIKVCSTEHGGCRATVIPELPSRYLDIGNRDGDIIKVATSSGETGTYACLSHCWGGQSSCTLNDKTKVQFLKGIPLNLLPPVFANAITVCRKLGIRRLWIDSLCIQQDSKSDWLYESQKMGLYYSKCAVCIAATSSANSSESFNITDRPTAIRSAGVDPQSGPFELIAYPSDLMKRRPHFVHTYRPEILLSNFPLLTRAWVLQERWLAPRVLHFCGSEVVFECAEMVTCECGGEKEDLASQFSVKLAQTKPGAFDTYSRDTTTSRGLTQRRQQLRGVSWNEFVTTYSSLNLTCYSDRLIAISGVASMRHKGPSTDYLAGLWRQTLHRDMAWFVGETLLCIDSKYKKYEIIGSSVERKQRPSQYLAPSWSWASVLDPVRYISAVDPGQEALFKVLDIHINLATKDPFGSVEEGCSLHIRGKILESCWEIRTGADDTSSFILTDLIGTQQLDQEDVRGMAFAPDFAIEKPSLDQIPQTTKLYVLPITTTSGIGFDRYFENYREMIKGSRGTLCLVLRDLCENDRVVYERVGFVEYANFRGGIWNIDKNEYVMRDFFIV